MSEASEKRYITRLVENCVAYIGGHGGDCVVLGVDQDGYYCMKSSVGKSYTWVLMDMAQAKLRQEIEQDGQSTGENDNQGRE